MSDPGSDNIDGAISLRRSASLRRKALARRGNTIVLVTGILVLLVIIAAAYISRTQAARGGADAQVRSGLRDDNARAIADDLAEMIAMHLFVRPYDPTYLSPLVDVAKSRRLPPPANAVRYGRDPNFPCNVAPFEVVPYTNWPDRSAAASLRWTINLQASGAAAPLPSGPGNLEPVFPTILQGEGNAMGLPGMNDHRWLRDFEPLRWDTRPVPPPNVPLDGQLDAFSHWRHLTSIVTPENSFRIVRDISNIEGVTDATGNPAVSAAGLSPNFVANAYWPYEQWLAVRPAHPSGIFGPSGTARVMDDFWFRWNAWFNNYPNVYVDPGLVPPNLYKLNDLDADGYAHRSGAGGPQRDRPEDEFVPGTARNAVCRVLADADGDGFTDSFWYLVPSSIHNGLRQVMAVSIIDNQAMINVNVATRFLRDDGGTPAAPKKTRGLMPSDLALVSNLAVNDQEWPSGAGHWGNWNVGFFDNPEHDYFVESYAEPDPFPPGTPTTFYFFDYDTSILPESSNSYPASWQRHSLAVGLPVPVPGIVQPTAVERLGYWRNSASSPLGASVASNYTPFSLADEIELRMFAGQNVPWTFSRFEQSVQRITLPGGAPNDKFTRSGLANEESSEYLDQRSNRKLLVDKRRMMTMYNSVRNDLMPPWLWDPQQPNIPERKLDLRLQRLGNTTDMDGSGGTADDADARLRLRQVLQHAFSDDESLVPAASTVPAAAYHGRLPADRKNTKRMAAAYAANIWQARDADNVAPLAEAVPLPADPSWTVEEQKVRYLGMEKQPFLVEAFIAYDYESKIALNDHPQQLIIAGNHVLCDNPRAIIAVQVANPYDTALSLADFRIKMFGQTYPSSAQPAISVTLAPHDDPLNNDRHTFYLINFPGDPAGEANWRSLLKLNIPPPSPPSSSVGAAWTNDRAYYDSSAADERHAIEIVRPSVDAAGNIVDVVVDRIDIRKPPGSSPSMDTSFGTAVTDDTTLPRPVPQGTSCTEPPNNAPWPGAAPIDNTHFVQWVHVTRAWETGSVQDNNRNPRFIFPDRKVTPFAGGTYDSALPPMQWFEPDPGTPGKFSTRIKGFDGLPLPDTRLNFALQMLQKNADFEQVGELLNVWTFGHELRFNADDTLCIYVDAGAGCAPTSDEDGGTIQTFSEQMQDDDDSKKRVGTGPLINRLRFVPALGTDGGGGQVVGRGDPGVPSDYRHSGPALPATVRMLDAFVCDGPGANPIGPSNPWFNFPPQNAKGFSGAGTPGLININTAPVEVLRSVPHWYRLVHETGFNSAGTEVLLNAAGPPLASATQPLVTNSADATALLPRAMIPEAITHYRERFNGWTPDLKTTGIRGGPDYFDSALVNGVIMSRGIHTLRGDRGMASIGEVLLLGKSAAAPLVHATAGNTNDVIYPQYWRIDMGVPDPNDATIDRKPVRTAAGQQQSLRLSTDVNPPDPSNQNLTLPDTVAGDAEEMNLLFAGASNLITTRSDTFTVYFRIRSFRQNPQTGVWDATNPEYIVDDSRYVMLVDRSNVNRPSDRPRILYLEKLPN